ncbi:SH3-like domain-containing protein [Streptomyces sp. NPDC001135]
MTAGGVPGEPPAFRVGQHVRVRSADPAHHTRAPRYVRGHVGLVRVVQDACELPDDIARGRTPAARLPVYTVAFPAHGLWCVPPAGAGDEVLCDLWECYLDMAVPGDGTDQEETR